MIRIENATKAYGTSVVVDGVTLDLPTGGVASIVGPNGAGKSTLLSTVARLLPLDGGKISVAGLDVTTADTRELARVLAMLKQDNPLTVRLSVEDLVSFGRYPHSRGRLTDTDRALVRTAISYLDLEGLEGRFLDELSGGQRQRAFVAMVLAQDTDYLLLDEPLNNLDMPHARSMMRRLRRTADELNKTVVIVIHDINFAASYSDQIIAMKDGRVCRQGSPAEIMTSEALREIYDMDLEVHEIDGRRFAQYYV